MCEDVTICIECRSIYYRCVLQLLYHCIYCLEFNTAKSINALGNKIHYDNEVKVVTLGKKSGTPIADLSHSFNQCGVFKGEVPVNWMFTDHHLPDSLVEEEVWGDLPTFS